MRAVIEVNMSGAAFEGDPTIELARILKDLAGDLLNNHFILHNDPSRVIRLIDHSGRVSGQCSFVKARGR